MTWARWWSVGTLAFSLGGCALTSKGETLDPHYFTPEGMGAGAPAAAGGAPSATRGTSRGPLRLGRVRAAVSIKEKIIYRESQFEVGYYEERRWTEKPDVYFRRALAQALFEDGSFVQSAGGAAPTLDAELFAFEEVRGDKPFVRVGVTLMVRDDDAALVEKTLVIEEPIVKAAGEGAETALVRAFSVALGRTVTRTVDETARGTASFVATAAASASASAARPYPLP